MYCHNFPQPVLLSVHVIQGLFRASLDSVCAEREAFNKKKKTSLLTIQTGLMPLALQILCAFHHAYSFFFFVSVKHKLDEKTLTV